MSRNGFHKDTIPNNLDKAFGPGNDGCTQHLFLVCQKVLLPCINSVVRSNHPLTVSLQKVQLDQGAIKLFCEYSGGPVKVGSVMFTSVEELAEGVAHNFV